MNMRYSEIAKKALAAAGLALMLSVGAAAAGVYGWHNPLTEKPKGAVRNLLDIRQGEH